MTNLIGKYHISKSNLVGDSKNNPIHLVIAQRKKIEGTKPKQYLLLKTAQNSFKYVSSLYPSKVDAMAYEIDYTGNKYLLKIEVDAGEAIIIPSDKITNGRSITMSISALEAHFLDNQNSSL